MMKLRILVPLGLFCLVLQGCGGGSSVAADGQASGTTAGGTDTVPANVEDFSGTWSGTYVGKGSGIPLGTVSIKVVKKPEDPDGAVSLSGTATDAQRGSATVAGFLTNDLNYYSSLVLTFPDGALNEREVSYAGRAKLSAQGHLLVLDDPAIGGAPENPKGVSFDLVKTAP